MGSCRARSVYLTTRLLESSKRLTSVVHILSPETDNCPSWISGRERMSVENISWSISTKECCRPRRGLKPRPFGLQSDGASNWTSEAGNAGAKTISPESTAYACERMVCLCLLFYRVKQFPHNYFARNYFQTLHQNCSSHILAHSYYLSLSLASLFLPPPPPSHSPLTHEHYIFQKWNSSTLHVFWRYYGCMYVPAIGLNQSTDNSTGGSIFSECRLRKWSSTGTYDCFI